MVCGCRCAVAERDMIRWFETKVAEALCAAAGDGPEPDEIYAVDFNGEKVVEISGRPEALARVAVAAYRDAMNSLGLGPKRKR